MFLATTANYEIWDTDGKVLFLGEWCKRYDAKNRWAGLDHETLDYHWRDHDRVVAAHRYCWCLYRKVLPVVSAELNRYHRIDEKAEYYDIILGNWLFTYISQLFDKYTGLTNALEKNPGIKTNLLHEDQFTVPANIRRFRALITDDDRYALQHYSQILSALGYDFPKKRLDDPLPQETVHHEDRKAPLAQKLFYHLQRLLAFGSDRPKIVAVNSYFWSNENLPDILKLYFKGWPQVLIEPVKARFSISCELDPQFRKTPLPSVANDPFHDIVHKLVIGNLPLLYVEGFKPYRERIAKARISNVKVFYTANDIQNDSYSKFTFAEKRAEVKICVKQHGGGYGTKTHNRSEEYERQVADRFYTWGWSDDKSPPAKYLPAPAVKYNRHPPNHDNGVVLLPLTIEPRYKYDFEHHFNSDDQIGFFKLLTGFTDNLDEKAEIVIREYFNDYSWSTRERLLEYAAKKDRFTFDDHKKKLPWLMERCRVVVFFLLSTGYLQALAMNKPTILIIPERFQFFRSQAQPLFDQLSKVGIMHSSNESACAHLNGCYDDIMAWWGKDEVQAARQAFVEQHARSDADWVEAWLDEMRRLL